ncbi:hypothetical protein CC78DRAFT_533839 [Lojkania enalia]|uniref:dihydroneopterin aldolase n=1 Tax=Lojkania enalia TaxID=147567 RepID=A0A9P4N3G9_9PLEO|nr:hypothetical protein CC78DRAFT_533839 [Didymosphaeria enalia]
MSAQLVRHSLWESQLVLDEFSDRIIVRNLEATVNAGLDVWGRPKEQRAVLTTTLSLDKPFVSAAEADALDNSTVHYGKLSKNIRGHLEKSRSEWSSTGTLARAIESASLETADNTPVSAIEVDICYPKGSMLGDGAGLIYAYHRTKHTLSRVLYLRNVRIPCIIGVNSNERPKKQPVVVNLWIESLPENRTDDYVRLEEILVEAISETSFGTLEALSTTVVQELRNKFFGNENQGAYIKVRIEKPLAVPFADAPVIEMLRPAFV